jgi:type II secretory ATPase GspE/PulE/Tfp pilus assembly ATPase PilB-like protein
VDTPGCESLWQATVALGLVTDDAILSDLAARFKMTIADVDSASAPAVALVPEQLARRFRILPLQASDTALHVAIANPHDIECERVLGFALARTVHCSLAAPGRILERLDEVYRADATGDPSPRTERGRVVSGASETGTAASDVHTHPISASSDSSHAHAADALRRPTVRLVDEILATGISSRASDIHIETEERAVAVRYRVDGILQPGMVLPRETGIPLVSRIKIMARLDIADRLRPQDGRARVSVDGHRVDLRISTLPAAEGEKVVVRILDARATVLSLDALGFTPYDRERVGKLLELREGVVLVTGPTGSGKTTTLYSLLRDIQRRGVNIVTVEDPVEYRLRGIVQVQVNEKAGLTFAAALRSILRQDPDVVLLGEIRDRETATIAVQASLTGHLVLSTVHTIDAPGAVTRLADIGVESFKIAAALRGIIAQRLLRRLCPACKGPWTGHLSAQTGAWFPEAAALRAPRGCASCSSTGFRGRLAVTEVLIATPELERRIAANEPLRRLVDASRAGGMRSLWESGVAHCVAGETSPDELLRVLDPPRTDDGVAQMRVSEPAAPWARTAPSGSVYPRPVDIGALVDATPRVVVACASEALAAALRDTLTHHGCRVTVAASLEQVLTLQASGRHHAFVVDHRLLPPEGQLGVGE